MIATKVFYTTSLMRPALRYLEILLPPLCLLIGRLIVDAGKRSHSMALVLTCLLIGPAAYDAVHNYSFYRDSLVDVCQAANFSKNKQGTLVYTGDWCRKQIKLYLGSERHDIRMLDDDSSLASSWVIVRGSRGFDVPTDTVTFGLPKKHMFIYLDHSQAPGHWQLAFQRSGCSLPSRESDLVIFQVGARRVRQHQSG
jgi:hypothetical protein